MRYASLRQGLVGAWCPSVSGPYGYRLPDLSGYGNHGTLTNMDPGSDWVGNNRGVALDFDGNNDYVISYARPNIDDVSVGCWVKLSSTSQKGGFVKYGGYLDKGVGIGVGNTTLDNLGNNLIFLAEGAAWRATTTALGTDWVHVFLAISGSNWTTYFNGRELSSFTQVWSRITDAGQEIRIGGYDISGFQRYPNCMIDDVRLYNRKVTTPEIRLLASERGIGLKPERQRNRYLVPALPSRNRSSRFLGFPS